MENVDCDKSNNNGEETTQLSRNRSFKSKQLVRSQAIRETHSPPRIATPEATPDPAVTTVTNTVTVITSNDNANRTLCPPAEDDHDDDGGGISDDDVSENVKYPVEIQITGGAWDRSGSQRQRTKRWLGTRDPDSTHLLSNSPRVACVCGTCAACPHCRGRRRRPACPTKQDSGIVCSDECPDCSDSELTGGSSTDGIQGSASLDVEDQTYFCRCPERKEKPKTPTFSRTDSDERSEPTGADLVNFLKETLNKNPRDRMTLLKIEKELHSLVNDTGRCIVRFPVMTSYGRMLVHRCASLFQLSHHLDHATKTAVLVSKSGTCGGRIPCTEFKEWCTTSFPPSPQRAPPDHTNAKSILKRASCSLGAGGGVTGVARSRSLEQRERDYERVRRRIFSSDNCTQDESQWPWLSGPVKLLTPEGGNRNKLLKVQSLEGSAPWRQRGAVSKSHSFGGYGTDRGHHPRLLSKQGDLASSSWRLSPSSSGYKTLSLRSTDSVTPSPTGGASPEPCPSGPVVWAVTDLAAVPRGASVIHPQTGRPLVNPDGSVYRFDPANPPILYDTNSYAQDNKNESSCDKRRGRLEKQHSFSDNGCECQPVEECRNKCCCDCRRQETCPTNTQKQDTKPQSPVKPRFEPPTNQKPEPRLQYEPTNQKPETPYARNSDQSRSLDGRGFEQRLDVRERQDLRKANSVEVQEYQYIHGYRPQEQTIPSQHNQYVPQEVGAVSIQPMVPQQAVTPLPVHDGNIRPVSLSNTMYPAPVHQTYPYIGQCRLDQTVQYQQVMPQATEDIKMVQPAQMPADNTFRIDASYPYAAVDYSACGACVDTTMQQHRGYNVPYGQMEVPAVVPTAYPIGNVMLPQPHMQHYQYPEAAQWGTTPKVYVPELYPLVPYQPCPAPYPHYNVVYPQVVPQTYQLCQPVYPVVEKPEQRSLPCPRQKRNSVPPSARATPQSPDTRVSYEEQERRNEIALKIQQIKDHMSQLNMEGRGDGKTRNCGNGLLGSYPSGGVNGAAAGRNSVEDNQLSTAAQAIVNSLRNMQVKNTYQPPAGERSPRRRPDRDGARAPRPQVLLRHMSPNTWTRRSPGPAHPAMNQPRYPHPDSRNSRR